MTNLVKERFFNSPELDSIVNGYILDGFPRTIEQAKLFEELLANNYQQHNVTHVLNINLPQDILIEKACARRVCQDCGQGYNIASIKRGKIDMKPLLPKVENVCDVCGGKIIQRDDDTEQIVANRLNIYNKEAQAILDYYENKDNVHVIQFDVYKGMEDTNRLIQLMEKYL